VENPPDGFPTFRTRLLDACHAFLNLDLAGNHCRQRPGWLKVRFSQGGGHPYQARALIGALRAVYARIARNTRPVAVFRPSWKTGSLKYPGTGDSGLISPLSIHRISEKTGRFIYRLFLGRRSDGRSGLLPH